jgi:hypothetical protein
VTAFPVPIDQIDDFELFIKRIGDFPVELCSGKFKSLEESPPAFFNGVRVFYVFLVHLLKDRNVHVAQVRMFIHRCGLVSDISCAKVFFFQTDHPGEIPTMQAVMFRFLNILTGSFV